MQELNLEDRNPLAMVEHVVHRSWHWPGCYPIGLVLADGEPMCHACVAIHIYDVEGSITDSPPDGPVTAENKQWYPAGVYVADPDDKDTKCAQCHRSLLNPRPLAWSTKMEAVMHIIERRLAGREVHVGISTQRCQTCAAVWPDWTPTPQQQEPDDDGTFDRRACDACGTTISGHRHAAHGWRTDDPERKIEHFDVCADCVILITKGVALD